ncbi:SusD/RagB family nutrient-binding outer membrane lipoprotein [Danxiaibacter flavus]|uniref:SusD/RagB family nutrient-binding outer membrane lipoprotein n=1 Tax=Danxiaibacter flavus TaxID=3049108 RepID=A0ABV3ZED1_9BACT|nr:SusD/RagB family nutrient-binding outer membrane lipoprotein [Chitinophagaceae bacterium DXS]
MKRNLIICLAAGLLLFTGGCSKYLDKLDNPNLVTDPPLNGLLAEATFQSGMDVYRMGDIVSYYTQYLASNSKGSDADIYNEVDYSTTWTNFYNTMMNIQQMITLAEKQGASKHLGVGKILMALNLNMLVNSFGDVPYSEALKGQELLVPKFDDQATLLATCMQLVDDGIAALKQTDATLDLNAASDVIHGGSADAWIKTGYALKARFLNQWSKTSDYKPADILTALGTAYSSNADDAQLTAFSGRSPWNQVAYDNSVLDLDGWMSTQFIDATNGKTYGIFDPRLPKIATLTKFGDYRGTPNGAGRIGTGTDNEESYLSLDGFYSKSAAPLLVITYAETKFIEAEVAFRTNDKTRAYDAYLAGISANMDKLGVSGTDKATYMNNPAVSVGAANLTLDLIFKEKYVAMVLNPESWVDARRYDYKYKDFGLPVGAVMNTFIRRVAYPTVETSRNGANVPTISGLDEKLIWDK